MDGNPTSRALRALEVIQASPGISAAALGERLGVSERAARRYVATLREAGIAVEATRGPYGGFRAWRGRRTAPLRFDADEALSLVMAVLDGHHDVADASSGDPVASALTKLLGALSEPVARQAEMVRRAAALAPDRAAARPDPKTAALLVQACAEHRVVRLAYRSEAAEADRELVVQPWAVVVRHGRWYLLCHSRSVQATRTYRIDRVGEVQLLDETFEPPADLDPVAGLETHLSLGWEYQAEVLISATVEEVAAWIPPTLGRLEQLDATTTRLRGTTSNPWWYTQQLAGLHTPYRIVAGPELRATTTATARRMLAAVHNADPTVAATSSRSSTAN